MHYNNENTRQLMVIIDERPMFRTGIKKTIQSDISKFSFIEMSSFDDLSLTEYKNDNLACFIRLGNKQDKAIVNLIRRIKGAYKTCKIVLYDYQDSPDYIITLFKEEIDAYLPDNFDESDLKECFVSIGANRRYLDNQMALQLLAFKPGKLSERKVQFTPTEVKVAKLLVRGMRTSLIAQEMGKKISTISTIKSNIFKKAKVNNIIALANHMTGMQLA
jgi:DNA-binding NarL/FixJ family response regulator